VRTPTRLLRRGLLGLLLLLLATGCLPYSVGSTARTVPRGQVVSGTTFAPIVGAWERFADTSSTGLLNQQVLSVDHEWRYGLSDRSDLGFRVAGLSGLMLNYKRRHTEDASDDATAFASAFGAGVVNFGSHALVEGTVIWSGARRGQMTPYAGLRVLQAIPTAGSHPHDEPAGGAFLGLRFGDRLRAITPEIAVFYDSPALPGIRQRVVVAPSLTLTGFRFRLPWEL
jgi:hypothetical protein